MATKTTAKRNDRNLQETHSGKSSAGAKTLPAVSPLQQKSDAATVQKQGVEGEELLQGKFESLQKKDGGEEELLQGRFEVAQKIDGGEEELLQGKFDTVQKMGGGEEEEPLQMKTAATTQLENGGASPAPQNANKTGLPDNLKTGIENLSGMNIDNVRVHYNSDKPKQLRALAYAQGEDIHVGPGQEKHLAHEAWHVVQQRQGRVQPTRQMKTGVPVNDDQGLEHEADVMGAQALQTGNQLASLPMQQGSAAQLRAHHTRTTQLRDAGIFGDSYNESAEENPELAPGMNMMETGIDKSGQFAMAGAKKSWDFAAAPARWASKGIAGTDSKLKKAGYGIAGVLGSIGSGIGGAIGAVGSGVAGLAGAAISGTAGAVTTALGGAWMGAKKGAAAAKSGLLGMFNSDKSKTEKASNGLFLASIAATAGASTANAANVMAGQSAPSAQTGFAGGLSGSGEAIAGLGATAGILGAASSMAAAASFGKDAFDDSLGKHKRIEAAGASVSAIAAGTKSAASAAYNIASLVNVHGAAAAGALMATAGASIAMGAIDIIRGGYGIWTATQRESILAGIEAGAQQAGDSEIVNMAAAAKLKQTADRDSAIGNIAKGALAVAGGAALIIAAASPVGWVLLGLGGVVGGIMLLVKAVKSSSSKKQVVARVLGVKDQQEAYETELARIEKETWWGTDARKERMKDFKARYPKDPLTTAVREKGEGTVSELYDKHMQDTATMLYAQAVDPATANVDPTNDYRKIVEGLGLKIDNKDAANPQPSILKIKKALSL